MRGPRLLLALVVLTALTLVVLDVGGPTSAVRRGADVVLGPAQRAVGSVAERVDGGDDAETARLREEVARLRAELARGEGDRRRADALDALLALATAGTWDVVPAQVVAAGTAPGSRTVVVDAGSRDGVEPGQTVVSGDGLVGRTTRVGPFTSTVLLLTDPGSTVGSRIARTGGLALASGDGDALSLELVGGAGAQVGDALVTADASTYAPGVPLARVTAVDPAGPLLTTARAEPLVDLDALEVVGVVVSPPRGTPRVPLP